jgi:hypothetical protein
MIKKSDLLGFDKKLLSIVYLDSDKYHEMPYNLIAKFTCFQHG